MSKWINVSRGEWGAVFLMELGIKKMKPNVVYDIPDHLDVYMEDHRRIGLHKVLDIQKPIKMRKKILTESKPKKTRKKKK